MAVLQERVVRRRQARVDRNGLLIARGQLIDGREPVVVDKKRRIARIELDADAALALQMLLNEMELLRQLLHVEDLAVEPDAVGQERWVDGLELLDGQVAHDDAVHHAAHPVLLEQVVGAVLMLGCLRDLVKVGIRPKVKMCIDDFHCLPLILAHRLRGAQRPPRRVLPYIWQPVRVLPDQRGISDCG